MESDGLIFNIQKFSVHDGPGIRTTVFFKGCPLNCWWCHNIESQSFEKDPMLRRDLCDGCGACVASCPQGAIGIEKGRALTDPGACVRCGQCVVYCPQNGRSICGRSMSAGEILREVAKDKVFYEQSGGGVTFSGGEPLAQIDLLVELLQGCREQGFHAVVDTSGYAPWSHLERIIGLTDLFLYDVKLMDDEAHARFTGVSNETILENLRRLALETDRIFIRFPVIPGINDDEANLAATVAYLKTIRFQQINLLAYHGMGRGKASQLGLSYKMEGTAPPSPQRMEQIRTLFESAGFKAVIGG